MGSRPQKVRYGFLPYRKMILLKRGSGLGLGGLAALLLDLNVQPLDLLVQRGERDAEFLRRLSLVPVAFLQLADDDPALALFHDVKERSIRTGIDQLRHRRATGDVVRQQ